MRSTLIVAALALASCTAGPEAPLQGGDSDDAPVEFLETESEVEELVRDVLRESYPDLPADRITVCGHDAKPVVFFWARPSWGSVINPFVSLRYIVFYNKKLFEADSSVARLPREAARSIIAHELGHVHDYATTSNGLVRTGWTQVVHGKAEAKNERRTDLKAIVRGYESGLSVYRRWVYEPLGSKDLAHKRATYFTPEEIEAVAFGIREYPQLAAHWNDHPPLSLDEIEMDILAIDSGTRLPERAGCAATQLSCEDGSCIESWNLCDGTAQCPTGEDEPPECSESCPAGAFACGSGECFGATAQCDGVVDCFDQSDELACSNPPG